MTMSLTQHVNRLFDLHDSRRHTADQPHHFTIQDAATTRSE
jgi:hypothetical protein